MIVIVDYGMGNLGSILNMLRRLGSKAIISSQPEIISSADKLILPGVGAFDHGIKNLRESAFFETLESCVLKKKVPILGICLGMQLFAKSSEEGLSQGLGWIDFEFVRFHFEKEEIGLKVPHMGWNYVSIKKKNQLFNNMPENMRFYFVHSYHAVCKNDSDILTETYYGYNFVSAIVHENIYGVQFHPEKSHKFGMQLLKNFAECG